MVSRVVKQDETVGVTQEQIALEFWTGENVNKLTAQINQKNGLVILWRVGSDVAYPIYPAEVRDLIVQLFDIVKEFDKAELARVTRR